MTSMEIFTGLKSLNLQIVPLNGFARYDLRQLPTEGIVPNDSEDPPPVGIGRRIAGPLDKLQKIEQVCSLDLILRRGFLRTNNSDGDRRCTGQQQDGACETQAQQFRATPRRVEFRVVLKCCLMRNFQGACP